MNRDDALPSQQAHRVRRWRSPGRRRWLIPLLVAAGSLLILTIAGIVTVQLLNQPRTAEATAREYFDALAAGDATSANLLTEGFGPEGAGSGSGSDSAGTAFLTDEVLAAANERISDVEVVPSDDPTDVFDQRVVVSFTLAGRSYSEDITVSRGEPEWGVLRTWRMPRPFASDIVFSVEGPGTLMIAGAPINPDSAAGRAVLYPAVYPVEVLETKWVALEEDEIVADPDALSVNVDLRATDALTAEVRRQMDGFLDGCVDELVFPWGNEDTGCPFRASRSEGGTPIGSWEIVDYPEAAPKLGGSVYRYSGGDARFTPHDGSESATTLSGIDIARYVEVTEDAVTLSTEFPDGA